MAINYTAERDQNENRYEGRVLAKEHDQSYRIMSDIWGSADWATVWDDASASPKKVLVNVYDMNPESWRPVEIVVDATPDVVMAYHNYRYNRVYTNTYESLKSQAEFEAAEIRKDDVVEVVKGKREVGVRGKVAVKMLATYGMGWRASQEYKLGIATSDEKIKVVRNGKVYENYKDIKWVWARNAKKVTVPAIDLEAIQNASTEAAKREVAKLMG